MSAPTPSVSPELKVLMRKLRARPAHSTPCPSAWRSPAATSSPTSSSWSSCSATRCTRRDGDSAGLRARAAHLDPHMVLEAWDDDA